MVMVSSFNKVFIKSPVELTKIKHAGRTKHNACRHWGFPLAILRVFKWLKNMRGTRIESPKYVVTWCIWLHLSWQTKE